MAVLIYKGKCCVTINYNFQWMILKKEEIIVSHNVLTHSGIDLVTVSSATGQ